MLFQLLPFIRDYYISWKKVNSSKYKLNRFPVNKRIYHLHDFKNQKTFPSSPHPFGKRFYLGTKTREQ
jgi:hypothetical protein